MQKPDKKQSIAIAVVLIVTALLAALILTQGRAAPGGEGAGHDRDVAEESHEGPGHGEPEDHDARPAAPYKRGPHGGKLFEQGGYGVELTIYEQDQEPEFRVYTYQDARPLDPAESRVDVTVQRLGRAPQRFSFRKEGAYLKGDAAVDEPHSFKVAIAAAHAGKAYRFGFDQVEGRVTMTDERVKLNAIELLTAAPAVIEARLQLIGEIRLNDDRTVHVVPRLAGVVESVSANAGDRVGKGQVLAVISSRPLVALRSELQAARKRGELARNVFNREKALWEEKISAEQDYIQARNAMQEADIAVQGARQALAAMGADAGGSGSLSRYEIRSPISGTVTEKRLSIGESVKEDASIFVVADLSTVWAEMTVQAKDLKTVRAGQKVKVAAPALGQDASGSVSYVGALVGEQTRSAKARVVLANPDGSWRPGLPVNVELVSGELKVPVAVATEAIQTINDEPAVFGRYGDSFEARPVVLGRSDGRNTEIVSGLQPGERYAAKNSFLLKADLGKAGASHDH